MELIPMTIIKSITDSNRFFEGRKGWGKRVLGRAPFRAVLTSHMRHYRTLTGGVNVRVSVVKRSGYSKGLGGAEGGTASGEVEPATRMQRPAATGAGPRTARRAPGRGSRNARGAGGGPSGGAQGAGPRNVLRISESQAPRQDRGCLYFFLEKTGRSSFREALFQGIDLFGKEASDPTEPLEGKSQEDCDKGSPPPRARPYLVASSDFVERLVNTSCPFLLLLVADEPANPLDSSSKQDRLDFGGIGELYPGDGGDGRETCQIGTVDRVSMRISSLGLQAASGGEEETFPVWSTSWQGHSSAISPPARRGNGGAFYLGKT